MENDDNLTELDDIIIVSKTQLKRESHDIQNLGKRLAELTAAQLAALPLDEHLLEAINLAHKIQNKRSALKRHFQFIGKLLRSRDTDAIFAAMEAINKNSQVQIQRHHQAEKWRDKILEQGFDAIEAFVAERNHANRQRLRQLWRNYSHANDAKKSQHARLIYKDIKQAMDETANLQTARKPHEE